MSIKTETDDLIWRETQCSALIRWIKKVHGDYDEAQVRFIKSAFHFVFSACYLRDDILFYSDVGSPGFERELPLKYLIRLDKHIPMPDTDISIITDIGLVEISRMSATKKLWLAEISPGIGGWTDPLVELYFRSDYQGDIRGFAPLSGEL